MKPSNSVLSFYLNMLFIESIQSVRNSFIGNATLQKNGYSYLQNQHCLIKDEMVEDNGSQPIFITDIIEEKDFLDRLLEFENISIYKTIESNFSSSLNDINNNTYLSKIYDDLQVLLKRIVKLEDKDKSSIQEKLIELIANLKDKYSKTITYHEVFKHLIKESDVTFFKNKDLKYSFYQELYELAYTHYLIDDTEIEEADFIDAFISPTPMLLENKIRFSNNNNMVSYFLESLKPFFNGFTHIAIENSKVFLNKQSKLIKSGDIYTSLSRGKNKYEEEKKILNNHIIKLKEKFLK